jgi:hypothetical protein
LFGGCHARQGFKTIRELILYQYAKIIAKRALADGQISVTDIDFIINHPNYSAKPISLSDS